MADRAKRTEARTPLGDYTRVSNNYYTGGDGQPWSMNWVGLDNNEAGVRAGSYGNPAAPTYFGTAFLPGEGLVGQYVPDFDKNVNTPLGNLNLYSNYDIPNSIDADFTPNAKTNAYVQALMNLLSRR